MDRFTVYNAEIFCGLHSPNRTIYPETGTKLKKIVLRNTLLTMTQLQTSLLERLVTLNIFIFRLTRSKAKDDQGCSNTVHYPSLSSIILRKQILEALIFFFLIISTMVLHPSTDGWFSFVDTVQCPLCV